MIKFWLLSMAGTSLVMWLFLRVPQKILPQMQADGTRQILALWRDAMLAYKQDHAKFPEQIEGKNYGESLSSALAGENPEHKVYLDLDAVRIHQTVAEDGWGNVLLFDPENTGDFSVIWSPGPDGIERTADDIDSRTVTLRKLPTPVDPSEERPKPKSKVDKPAAP
jgi:hypothetical protein